MSISHTTTVHATAEDDSIKLVASVGAAYVDSWRPFVTVSVAGVQFFVHVDHVHRLAHEISSAVRDLRIPAPIDAVKAEWRKDQDTDLSFADWAAELFSFYDAEEDAWS